MLQFSAITDDGKHSFSEYILPERSITTTTTAVHNITVRFSGDQRVVCKAGNPVPAKPLQTCLHLFTQFLGVCSSSAIDYLSLLGHNASVFDTPRLLLTGGPTFTSKLNEMKVLFGDSLPVLKVLQDEPNSPLQPATNKLGDVYETLFSDKFDAHDTFEDIKALRNSSLPLHCKFQTRHWPVTANVHRLLTPSKKPPSWNDAKIPSTRMKGSFT